MIPHPLFDFPELQSSAQTGSSNFVGVPLLFGAVGGTSMPLQCSQLPFAYALPPQFLGQFAVVSPSAPPPTPAQYAGGLPPALKPAASMPAATMPPSSTTTTTTESVPAAMSPLTAMSPSAAAAQPAMGSLPATPTAPAIAPHENLGGVVIRYTPLLRQKLSGKWKKTAPNSYMLFRLDHIKVLKGQRIPANQINDMMSDWWDKLCTSKKNAYKEASRILQKHLDGINGPDGSVDHGPQRRPRAPRRHTGERPATAPTAYPRPPMTPPARPPTFAP